MAVRLLAGRLCLSRFPASFHADMTRHVRVLRRKGLSLRQTARATGLCLDTVRRMDAPRLFQTVARIEADGKARIVEG